MATIVYGRLCYDTTVGEGTVKFTYDLDDADEVVMLDTVNDWLHQLEALQKDLHDKLYADKED